MALGERVAEALAAVRAREARLRPSRQGEGWLPGRQGFGALEAAQSEVDRLARRVAEARAGLAAARALALPGDPAEARETVLALRERLAAAEAERAARAPAYDADPVFAYLSGRAGRGGLLTGPLDRWLARASGFEAERGKREILEALPGYLAARLAEAERAHAAFEAARTLQPGPGVAEAEAALSRARADLEGAERALAGEAVRSDAASRPAFAEAARLRSVALEIEGLASDWRTSGLLGSRLPAEAEHARLDAVAAGA